MDLPIPNTEIFRLRSYPNYYAIRRWDYSSTLDHIRPNTKYWLNVNSERTTTECWCTIINRLDHVNHLWSSHKIGWFSEFASTYKSSQDAEEDLKDIEYWQTINNLAHIGKNI